MSFTVWEIRGDEEWDSVISFHDKLDYEKKLKSFYIEDTTGNKIFEFLSRDAYQRLTDCRLSSDQKRGMIEFHRYVVNGQQAPVFDRHEDDHGGVHYCVNTVVYYLYKDPQIKGGNLTIYVGESEHHIDTRPLHGYIRAVAFAGNITHCATNMVGKGNRDCIVVQLFCTRRN